MAIRRSSARHWSWITRSTRSLALRVRISPGAGARMCICLQEVGEKDWSGVVVKLRRRGKPCGGRCGIAAADWNVLPRNSRTNFPMNIQGGHTSADLSRPRENMGGTLYLLFAAVAMLLAIGCGNVSILLLARGTARQHEFAVRRPWVRQRADCAAAADRSRCCWH